MRFRAVLTAVLILASASSGVRSAFASASDASPKRHKMARALRMKGFTGKVTLTELSGGDKIEVRIRTWRTTRDTVRGHKLFPVLVHGERQRFYFGRFGASKLPVLIFAASDPDHVDEYRAMSYQVSPNGALIGQQVVVDDAIVHGHADEVVSGRYQIAAVDPELGAIYSIAYQQAHFEGFFVSYEKLRVRQWEQSINAFIESDQGFLRDRSGNIIESGRFHSYTDHAREALLAANVTKLSDYHRHELATPAPAPGAPASAAVLKR